MATYFELTSLAHVKCSPHKPYIITSYECAPLAMIYSISMLDRWSHLHSFQLWLQSKTSTFAHLTSFTMLRSWPSTESLHHCPCTSLNKLMSVSKGGDIVGLVWRKFCLLAFYTIFTILNSCLLSFFTAFTCMVCIWSIMPIKSNICDLKLLHINAPSFIVRGPTISKL